MPLDREHLPKRVLSRDEVESLASGSMVIGEGYYRKAFLVKWEGNDAVLKIAIKPVNSEMFSLEAYLLERLNGSGGAPKLLAVSDDPLSILTSFVGHRTLKYVLHNDRHLPDFYLGRIGRLICLRVQELHSLGVAHNDLHWQNVMVTIPDDLSQPPKVSIIDYGRAVYVTTALSDLPTDDTHYSLNASHRDAFSRGQRKDICDIIFKIFRKIFKFMEELVPQPYFRMLSNPECTLEQLVAWISEAYHLPEETQPIRQVEKPQPEHPLGDSSPITSKRTSGPSSA